MEQDVSLPGRPDTRLCRAGVEDVARVEPLVAEYHAFEKITSTRSGRLAAIPGLAGDPSQGAIFLIEKAGARIGYIALCLGYSVEPGGRDAFIDEFLIQPDFRGSGIGSDVLTAVVAQCDEAAMLAVHLEVSRSSDRARSIYAKSGLVATSQFHLMTRKCRSDLHDPAGR